MLWGTLVHYKWYNLLGLIDFLRAHPIADHIAFPRLLSDPNTSGFQTMMDAKGQVLPKRFCWLAQ